MICSLSSCIRLVWSAVICLGVVGGCAASDPAESKPDEPARAASEALRVSAVSVPTRQDQAPVPAPLEPPTAERAPKPLPVRPDSPSQPVRRTGLVAADDLAPRENPLRGGARPSASSGTSMERHSSVGLSLESQSKPTGDRASKPPFDPIKENGLFFQGWPKPKLALVMTGRQDGYLEPCGCAGLDRMKGGLMRRHSFFEQLRRQWGWPVVAVDVGGLIKGFGRQTELKFQTTVHAMQRMGYEAIGLGKGELRLPTGELVSVVAASGDKPSPFVSANVGLFGFGSGLTPTLRVIQAGGMKLGVTSVLGKKFQEEIHNADLEMAPPETALQKILPELKKENCDLLILLAHATLDESIDLAKRFPEFQVVVTAGGAPEPPHLEPQKAGQNTLLVEVGEKGMAAVVLGFYDDPARPIRYQRVLLDSRYPSSPEIKQLFAAYQAQLKELGLAGLGVRAAALPRRELLGTFVGSAKCEPCHEESYRIWKKSGHAKAYDTLLHTDPPRNFDPECISCHVIGWHPTEYFPYEGGFVSKEKTPHLVDVGCESCHGPGSAHCEAEIRNDKALQEKLQKAMVLTKADAEKHFCVSCHDLDNSPDFDFKLYWPKVEHYEQ